jgi:hypothetical protein
MSSSTTAEAILNASKIYAISVYFIILIGGLIGNIWNIFLFNGLKIYRRNQCAFYLIAASIADFLLLLIALSFRIADYGFGYNPEQSSLVWCKIRETIVPAFSLMSFSSICFAAIDQYLSTHYNPWLRQLSTLKLAHRLVYTAMIIWTLHGIPFLIFFEIRPTSGCSIYNVGFLRYYSYVHFCVLSGILPITISGVSAVFAYLNVRRIVRRQVPVIRRRLDRQLTAMVLSKVAFLVGTIIPYVVFRMYIMNSSIASNNSIGIAIEQLISTIASSLFYLNSAVSSIVRCDIITFFLL